MSHTANKPTPCHCTAIRQAARQVTQIYDRHLAPTGLRASQLAVLRAIARHAPITVLNLAEVSVMDRTTTSRALRPLERDRLVSVLPGADARTRVVTITPEGRALMERTNPAWEQAQAEFERRFGAAETAGLRAQLTDVVSRMA
jgi:DNA-binding MarR family transcriptional regulator